MQRENFRGTALPDLIFAEGVFIHGTEADEPGGVVGGVVVAVAAEDQPLGGIQCVSAFMDGLAVTDDIDLDARAADILHFQGALIAHLDGADFVELENGRFVCNFVVVLPTEHSMQLAGKIGVHWFALRVGLVVAGSPDEARLDGDIARARRQRHAK